MDNGTTDCGRCRRRDAPVHGHAIIRPTSRNSKVALKAAAEAAAEASDDAYFAASNVTCDSRVCFLGRTDGRRSGSMSLPFALSLTNALAANEVEHLASVSPSRRTSTTSANAFLATAAAAAPAAHKYDVYCKRLLLCSPYFLLNALVPFAVVHVQKNAWKTEARLLTVLTIQFDDKDKS